MLGGFSYLGFGVEGFGVLEIFFFKGGFLYSSGWKMILERVSLLLRLFFRWIIVVVFLLGIVKFCFRCWVK